MTWAAILLCTTAVIVLLVVGWSMLRMGALADECAERTARGRNDDEGDEL